MDGEAGAAEQGALQLRGNSSLGAGVGAVPSGQRPGVDGGPEGGRVSSAEEAAWGRGVVADARDAEGGARLLWLAAEAGNLAAVEWLLERGVGLQSLTDLDEEPMVPHPPPSPHALCSWGSPPAAHPQLLHPHSATMAAASAARSHRLPHPVFAAVRGGSEPVLDALVRAGARVDVRDARGRTPLAWAASHGHDAMITALVARGASLTAMDLQGNVPRQLAYLHRRGTTFHPPKGRTGLKHASL
uniref:Uncharacterized protein n=1 Tax=Dunaliella tertiolecta TaxID=3047 RepID=A0A7S3VJ54_DUNTE